jgi:hypothetical protein
MKEVQKIAQKVLLLLLDILVFTWQVVREVILPTRSRKGNLLSSLLTFFVGLLERIVSFEKSVLQRPMVFTHKYVKQVLIIAVGFLFLLSSFEWTVGCPADTAANRLPEVTVCEQMAASAETITSRWVNRSVLFPARVVVIQPLVFTLSPGRTGSPLMGRRWLRIGVFRI